MKGLWTLWACASALALLPSGRAAPPDVAVAKESDAPAPLSAFALRKAERLVREQLPCLGCHRLGAEGGRLGPDLSAVGARLDLPLVLAQLTDPEARVPGSIMPRVAWRPGQRDLVARFLVQQRTPAGPPTPLIPVAPAADRGGPALYGRYCAPCHGLKGDGKGPNAASLPVAPTAHRDAALMSRRPDDTLFDGIYGGGAILGNSHRMPAYGQTLTTAEIRSLVAHIRTLCACQGPAWSRTDRAPKGGPGEAGPR